MVYTMVLLITNDWKPRLQFSWRRAKSMLSYGWKVLLTTVVYTIEGDLRILQLAEKHGIPVLKNVVVDKGEIPEGLEYPLITKAAISTIGAWKKDVFICNNQEELEEAYKHIRSSRVMLQKYIHKKNELALEAVSANKGTNFCVTIASTYNYILPDTYSPYMTVTNFKDEDLKSKLEAMIREIGFEGIMMRLRPASIM